MRLFQLTILPSIRFEFIGGTEMVFLSRLKSCQSRFHVQDYNKRRIDEHRTSLRGSGIGNAVTRGNLFLKKIFFWLSENENLFSGKRKGRIYSSFPIPLLQCYFSFSRFFLTLPLFIASQKVIESTRNDAMHVSSQLSVSLVRCDKPTGAFFCGFIFLSFKILLQSVSCFSYSW
jgi:hypothetical protein